MTPFRVMVVDDSAFMRKALTRIVESDSNFRVVATARNGLEAIDALDVAHPDVITLDVEMPRLNGLETLHRIRARRSIPVLMVSSVTRSVSALAIQCLEAGALEIVPKPERLVSMDIPTIAGDLLMKLRAAVGIDGVGGVSMANIPSAAPELPENRLPQCLVTIGSSTGGPVALQRVLSRLPADLAAGVVIVQHMPAGSFIHSLAERLDSNSALSVRVAQHHDTVKDGVVLIAETGRHIRLRRKEDQIVVELTAAPSDTLHRPSIDVLFQSAGDVAGRNNISVILTGMGADGSVGLQTVRRHGGHIIAESEKTSVIFGMPRVAIESGIVDRIADIDEVPDRILERLETLKESIKTIREKRHVG